MGGERPSLVALDPDDYHARYAGWAADGRQFFLSRPFVPATGGNEGCEFIALYLFDEAGELSESIIETLGPRNALDEDDAIATFRRLLASVEPVERRRIEIRPFSLQHDGVEFGLIIREPDLPGEVYAVEAQPGNYMAFFEPWNSGEYDT